MAKSTAAATAGAPKAKAKSTAATTAGSARRPGAKAIRRKKHSRHRADQLKTANARQKMRKVAVRSLNALASELELERVQVALKGLVASEPMVDRLIRALEPRCHTDAFAQRLRNAVQLWKDNSGYLSQPMTGSDTDPDASEKEDDNNPDWPFLPRHRVLQPGYILKSKAFMLTFNSDASNGDVLVPFEQWAKRKRMELGARRVGWAARSASDWTLVPCVCLQRDRNIGRRWSR